MVEDHDHESGKERGLICGLCNSGLGFFRDSTASRSNAIEYLVKSGKDDRPIHEDTPRTPLILRPRDVIKLVS